MKFKKIVHHVFKQCRTDVHAKTGHSMSVVFTVVKSSNSRL